MSETPKTTPRRRTRRASAGQAVGRLVRYKITGLFGMFNYDFDLDPEGPTLLTGVNGTGKSTILRTIDGISTGSWGTLLRIPFRSLTLGFDSKREFNISRAKTRTQISLTGEDDWSIPQRPALERTLEREEEILAASMPH